MKPPACSNVEEYLAAVADDPSRKALERIRSIVLDEAPDAKETISYGIPYYSLDGFIAAFGAFKNHCSYFPGGAVVDFADELREFKTSKGTVQFSPDRPIPEPLLRAMIRARIRENREKAEAKRAAKSRSRRP